MPTTEEIVAQNRKDLEAQNKAAMERTENVQPTPTQDEIDSAKLATPTLESLDGKEDHGAPEERAVEAGATAEYRTRASRAGRAAKSAE
ncbi:hypothetical protein [Sphingomonas sp. CFBP 13720]|uniref:hypothetical protein n=1 Tax=Sphingomonas sp. CFBP 13720 TaxID=2775302 RepID=UPI001780D7F3|nr:hypothetical protein [Sphingomonas sp. CFBP 13720]MBD8677936.1 hypothetical protein [Sphingomonas sp. CFBP 13720]